MKQIEELIKAYQAELDFINKTIAELEFVISQYNNISLYDTENDFLRSIQDDFDANSVMATSYHANLEYFKERKVKVEEYLKKINALK